MKVIEDTRLDELIEAEAFLECLHNVGVDNWEGYEEAQRLFNEDNEIEEAEVVYYPKLKLVASQEVMPPCDTEM